MRKKLPAVKTVGIDNIEDEVDNESEPAEYGLEDILYKDLETGEGFVAGQVLQGEAVDSTVVLAANGEVAEGVDNQNLFETDDGMLEKCGNLIRLDGKLYDVLGQECHLNSDRVLKPNDRGVCCWNCTLPFSWAGMGCVDHYDHRRNTFYLFGYFCSFNCCKRYLLDRNRSKDGQRSEALSLLYRRFRKKAIAEGVTPPPPVVLCASPCRLSLEKYGGCMSVSQYRESIGVFDVRITKKVDAIFLTNDQPILKSEKTVSKLPAAINTSTAHGTTSLAPTKRGPETGKGKESVVVNKRGRTKRSRGDVDSNNHIEDEPVKKLPNFGEVFDQARVKGGKDIGPASKNNLKLKRKKEVHESNRGGTLDSFMNITTKRQAK